MTQAVYLPDAPIDSLVAQISAFSRTKDDIVLLLVGEHSQIDLPALVTALDSADIPFAGGVFPGVIYKDRKYETGMVANVLPRLAANMITTWLDTIDFQITNVPKIAMGQQATALILADGLTNHIALFLERLFRIFSNRVRYIGGGAGSLSFNKKPCVFDNSGIYQDAALVLWLKTNTTLGVRHGWQQLRGPLIATRTAGTRVQQLNNQPAFQVYNQIIQSRTGIILTKDNFFEVAKEYPLGIYHPGVDYIVRDPITFTDEQELICVGEVKTGSMIYILQGDKENLIQNAHLATHESTNNLAGTQQNLIVDCISRVLYLEDDFNRELEAVLNTLHEQSPPPFGMLTLGEIASYKTGRVEFFNKTMVVGSLQNIS